MAINKRAKNLNSTIKGTHTMVCGTFTEISESITITSTKENLQLISNKKVMSEGKSGGLIFGEYVPLEMEPKITKIYWMDENQENIIEEVNLNQTVYLIAETDTEKEGLDVSISVNAPNQTEIILNGVTEENGIAKIKWVYI